MATAEELEDDERKLRALKRKRNNESVDDAEEGKKLKKVKGKGKEKEQALFLDDVDEENEGGSAPVHDLAPEDLEEIDLDIDADEDDDEDEDEPVKPTRKRAAPASRAGVASPTKGKKRTAAVLDDDSDSGMTFRGFAGRKKTRAK